jgi:hypothetical protein
VIGEDNLALVAYFAQLHGSHLPPLIGLSNSTGRLRCQLECLQKLTCAIDLDDM